MSRVADRVLGITVRTAAAIWLVAAAPMVRVCLGANENTPVEEVLLDGRTLKDWVAAASDSDAAVRNKATRVLSKALDHSKASVRVAALDGLCDRKEAVKELPSLVMQRMAKEKEPWVREALLMAIVDLGEASVPTLLAELAAKNADQKFVAMLSLRLMGPKGKAAIPALERALVSEDPKLHEAIREALEAVQADASIGPLVKRRPAKKGKRVPQTVASIRQDSTGWPQFHGPERDSVSRETGLNLDWNKKEPSLLWQSQKLGRGYSSISIASRTVFTMGAYKANTNAESGQFVTAIDIETGVPRWRKRIDPKHELPGCTPSVDAGRVYAVSSEGALACLDSKSGRELWRRHLVSDFQGKVMSYWKFYESPLVDLEQVVITPGGTNATIVALDKTNGKLIWKTAIPELGDQGADGAGYGSMTVAEIDGVRQYVQIYGRGVFGVEAKTGRFLWGYNAIANKVVNATTPVVFGNLVFVTTSYRTGSALVEVARQGRKFSVQERYFIRNERLANHHGGVVRVGEHIFGGGGENRGAPFCLHMETGHVEYGVSAPVRGSASIVFADGHLVYWYDRGIAVAARAVPERFEITGKLKPAGGSGGAYAHPVIHGGRLYLRHGRTLSCYNIKQQAR